MHWHDMISLAAVNAKHSTLYQKQASILHFTCKIIYESDPQFVSKGSYKLAKLVPKPQQNCRWQWQRLYCLSYHGFQDTNRFGSACVMLPKVAKALCAIAIAHTYAKTFHQCKCIFTLLNSFGKTACKITHFLFLFLVPICVLSPKVAR